MSRGLRRSLHSLAVPNFRRYFTGQAISLAGTWMQTVAETWLVLRLTGSGVALGISTALQFAPVLVAGAWGGLLADRLPKRRLLVVTQALMAVPALALWALTAFGDVRVWVVFALIFARGHGDGGRQPHPPELRQRDGRPRPRAQRRLPELRAGPDGPDRRARPRGAGHRDPGRRRVLPGQRPLLHGHARRAAPHGPRAARARAGHAARPRAGPRRRCASSAPRPRCARRCCSSPSWGRCRSTSPWCCRCWPGSPSTAARRPTRC